MRNYHPSAWAVTIQGEQQRPLATKLGARGLRNIQEYSTNSISACHNSSLAEKKLNCKHRASKTSLKDTGPEM